MWAGAWAWVEVVGIVGLNMAAAIIIWIIIVAVAATVASIIVVKDKKSSEKRKAQRLHDAIFERERND